MLRDVGIKAEAVVDDINAVYYAKTFRGDFDGLAQGYHGPSEVGETLSEEYLPGGARNFSQVNDPVLTDKVNKVQSELDPQKRLQLIRDIQTDLAKSMYYVPTVYDAGPQWQAWNPRVKGAPDLRVNRGGRRRA